MTGTPPGHAVIDTLADSFFAAIETGDMESVKACYADDAAIWHNTNCLTQSPADNIIALQGFFERLRARRYVEIRRLIHPGGFVQQHILTGTLENGRSFAWPACLVVAVQDGLITRIDEYLDSAPAVLLAS